MVGHGKRVPSGGCRVCGPWWVLGCLACKGLSSSVEEMEQWTAGRDIHGGDDSPFRLAEDIWLTVAVNGHWKGSLVLRLVRSFRTNEITWVEPSEHEPRGDPGLISGGRPRPDMASSLVFPFSQIQEEEMEYLETTITLTFP